MKDYLANFKPDPTDKVDSGVKGMKWGVRRSRKQLAAARQKRESESEDTPTKKSSGPETSADRYNRLKAQAKQGKGNQMSDDDLKFFNARTEALAKVNKLNQNRPGWLAETSKKVIQKSAQNGMQEVAEALRQKHITGPLIAKINEK